MIFSLLRIRTDEFKYIGLHSSERAGLWREAHHSGRAQLPRENPEAGIAVLHTEAEVPLTARAASPLVLNSPRSRTGDVTLNTWSLEPSFVPLFLSFPVPRPAL